MAGGGGRGGVGGGRGGGGGGVGEGGGRGLGNNNFLCLLCVTILLSHSNSAISSMKGLTLYVYYN